MDSANPLFGTGIENDMEESLSMTVNSILALRKMLDDARRNRRPFDEIDNALMELCGENLCVASTVFAHFDAYGGNRIFGKNYDFPKLDAYLSESLGRIKRDIEIMDNPLSRISAPFYRA